MKPPDTETVTTTKQSTWTLVRGARSSFTVTRTREGDKVWVTISDDTFGYMSIGCVTVPVEVLPTLGNLLLEIADEEKP